MWTLIDLGRRNKELCGRRLGRQKRRKDKAKEKFNRGTAEGRAVRGANTLSQETHDNTNKCKDHKSPKDSCKTDFKLTAENLMQNVKPGKLEGQCKSKNISSQKYDQSIYKINKFMNCV